MSGRPLLNLSFALNHAISGTEPWSYHLLNLLLHVLAGWTLYGILRRIQVPMRRLGRTEIGMPTAGVGGPGYSGIACVAALLWTVHPLQTEAVTYTVQRAESLMGLCYLVTLYGFIRGAEKGRRGWLPVSIAACLVGTGVKESIATAPLVVFAYDAVFVSGGWGAAWRARRGYYLALAATWVPLGWLVVEDGSRGGSAGFDVGARAVHYWLTQGAAVLHYLKLCFWPHPLVFVSAPLENVVSLGPILAAVFVLAGFAAALAGLIRRKPWGFLGTTFFLLLAPTSVIPGTMQEIAEHRMYLPLSCVLVAIVATVGKRWAWPLALLAIPLVIVSRARNRDYRSPLALWAATVRDSPRSAQAESSYAAALAAAGQPAEASEHFRRALDLAPPDQRHCDLALAWEQAGRPDGALDEFRQALALHPHFGFAELGAGRALFALGRVSDAEAELRQGLADSPRVGTETAAGTLLLGACLGRLGRAVEAETVLRQAVRLDPDSAAAHYDLGQALRAGGHSVDARVEIAKALAIDPGVGKAPVQPDPQTSR